MYSILKDDRNRENQKEAMSIIYYVGILKMAHGVNHKLIQKEVNKVSMHELKDAC